MKLQGKVAVITGAGSGIGRASAKLFAMEGAKILAADISEQALDEVVKEITQAGGEATAITVDVGKVAENQKMIETAIQKYGRIDILFNNAGVAGETLSDTTEESWHRTVDVNLTGPYFACTFAIPYMRKQGGGVILNTGSTGGLRAAGRSPSYTATKAAIIMLTKALAKILAKDNIRVNSICPGPTETALSDAFLGFPKTEAERQKAITASLSRVPMGRYARADEVAAVALFMVSDDASFVDGVAWLVDGGLLA
jgi:NAD(P)-dependent dehydrogenase (short-subunit alcohol dehydrogenase family)